MEVVVDIESFRIQCQVEQLKQVVTNVRIGQNHCIRRSPTSLEADYRFIQFLNFMGAKCLPNAYSSIHRQKTESRASRSFRAYHRKLAARTVGYFPR